MLVAIRLYTGKLAGVRFYTEITLMLLIVESLIICYIYILLSFRYGILR